MSNNALHSTSEITGPAQRPGIYEKDWEAVSSPPGGLLGAHIGL